MWCTSTTVKMSSALSPSQPTTRLRLTRCSLSGATLSNRQRLWRLLNFDVTLNAFVPKYSHKLQSCQQACLLLDIKWSFLSPSCLTRSRMTRTCAPCSTSRRGARLQALSRSLQRLLMAPQWLIVLRWRDLLASLAALRRRRSTSPPS